MFYAPDVAAILDQKTALDRVMLYIGDGASIVRPLLRRRGKSQLDMRRFARSLSGVRRKA